MNKSSNSPTNEAEHFSGSPPVCIVCDDVAVGLGPYSHYYLCQTHLEIDVAQVRQLKLNVNQKLQSYSRDKAAAFATQKLHITNRLQENTKRYALMMQLVNDWHDLTTKQLTTRQEAVEKCLLDCDDVTSYKTEVDEAETSGNMVGVFELAIAMQASLPDLAADFERAQCVCVEKDESEVECLRKLQQVVAVVLLDAETANSLLTDQSVASDAEATVDNTANTDVEREVHTAERVVTTMTSVSHELKLERCPHWVAVCSVTSEFRGNPRSGLVVPAESAGDDSMALPQPCLIVTHDYNYHFTVLSLDGAVKLRSSCSEVQWNEIVGLRCDRHFVFVAEESAVTMTDISGRVIHQILPESAGFDRFNGIGMSRETDSVFVSSLNKIAAFSKATGELQSVITLSQLPDARLGNLIIDEKNRLFVLVDEREHLHSVRIDSHQLIATYPTNGSANDVAIDSRGCVFYSEWGNHRVRAIAADGSELWTLGDSGSIKCKLNWPWGLAVVTLESKEQLVVADSCFNRLLVLNLH